MITVYAQYFNPTKASGKTEGDTEQELWSIPNQNGREFLPLTAVVNNEMGNAGSFEFSLSPRNPYYGIWKQMKTIVRVDYDGTTIFYGRVLAIDRDMFRTKRIHCEGALTFLMDSVFEGTQNGTQQKLNAYLVKLMETHNACMGNDSPEKKFVLCEVPGQEDPPNEDKYHYSDFITSVQKIKNDEQKFAKNKGYKTVKEWFEELVQDYGGFLRLRYAPIDIVHNEGTQNESHEIINLRLDWLKTYFNNYRTYPNQRLTVYKNVVDLSDTTEVDNIFTYVIPVGKNNKYIADGTPSGVPSEGGGGAFSVTVTKTGLGTASASTSSAKKDSTVSLSATPGSGYQFKAWTVSTPGSFTPVTLSGTGASCTFTMPESNVVAHCEFELIDGGIVL